MIRYHVIRFVNMEIDGLYCSSTKHYLHGRELGFSKACLLMRVSFYRIT